MRPPRALTLLLLALTAATPTTPEEARRAVDQAQRDLQSAQQTHAITLLALRSAMRDREDARRRLETSANNIDRANQRLADLDTSLDTAARAIPHQQAEVDRAKKDLALLQPAVAQADKRLKSSQANYDHQKETLWKQFQSTPDYAKAQSTHDTAKSRLDTVTKSRLDSLLASPDGLAASAASTSAETTLQSLRAQNADPQKIAAASETWMQSLRDLESMKQTALTRDPDVQAAAQSRSLAATRLLELKSQFEKTLPTHPDLAPLLTQLQSDKADLAKSTKELTTARTTLATAESKLKQSQGTQATAKTAITQTQNDLARFQRDQATAQTDHQQLEQKVRALEQQETLRRADLTRAQQTLQEKQADLDRTRRK